MFDELFGQPGKNGARDAKKRKPRRNDDVSGIYALSIRKRQAKAISNTRHPPHPEQMLPLGNRLLLDPDSILCKVENRTGLEGFETACLAMANKQEAASRSVDVGRETEGVQITLAAGAGQYQTKIASVGRSREIPRRGGAGALPEKGRKDQLL